MNDLPKKCQLTFVTDSGAQVTVLLAMTAELASKIISTAVEKNSIAILQTIVGDDKVFSDYIYLPMHKIQFYSLLQPKPESAIHSLDKKILRPS